MYPRDCEGTWLEAVMEVKLGGLCCAVDTRLGQKAVMAKVALVIL